MQRKMAGPGQPLPSAPPPFCSKGEPPLFPQPLSPPWGNRVWCRRGSNREFGAEGVGAIFRTRRAAGAKCLMTARPRYIHVRARWRLICNGWSMTGYTDLGVLNAWENALGRDRLALCDNVAHDPHHQPFILAFRP